MCGNCQSSSCGTVQRQRTLARATPRLPRPRPRPLLLGWALCSRTRPRQRHRGRALERVDERAMSVDGALEGRDLGITRIAFNRDRPRHLLERNGRHVNPDEAAEIDWCDHLAGDGLAINAKHIGVILVRDLLARTEGGAEQVERVRSFIRAAGHREWLSGVV